MIKSVKISWAELLIIVILVKGLVFPSWPSAFEFALVLALRAYFLYMQPKPIPQASEDDVKTLTEKVAQFQGELTQVKMFFGFNPAGRFSVFGKEKK